MTLRAVVVIVVLITAVILSGTYSDFDAQKIWNTVPSLESTYRAIIYGTYNTSFFLGRTVGLLFYYTAATFVSGFCAVIHGLLDGINGKVGGFIKEF